MNQPGGELGVALLFLTVSFLLCLVVMLGIAHLARPRRPRASNPPPAPLTDQELKTYLDHNALC